MPEPSKISDFLNSKSSWPILDVRSPGEYEKGHIPGAVNVPLLSDLERARVGTTYTQIGRAEAVELGLELVGSRLVDLLRSSKKVAPDGKVKVYCWRGGMRSESFAWLLKTAGFSDVLRLEGGYKYFRKRVKSLFLEPWRIILLGGPTGTGKTEILKELSHMGQQTIDLEALANHRGSAFGQVGLGVQPSTEQFENLLWKELNKWKTNQVLWLEDESHSIGSVHLPKELFDQMKKAPLLQIQIPLEHRVEKLVSQYAAYGSSELLGPLHKISKKLGGLATQKVKEKLKQQDMAGAARIILPYYDRGYQNCLARKKKGEIQYMKFDNGDTKRIAAEILKQY